MKNSSIGDDFYTLRLGLAGLSADQAARMLGVSHRTLKRWETGHIAATHRLAGVAAARW